MIDSIIFVVLISVAHYLDNVHRKKIYENDLNDIAKSAEKDLSEESKKIGKKISSGYMQMVRYNINRYGIIGDMDYEIDPESKYIVLGQQTYISSGIVLEKNKVMRDQLVDDLAKFYETTKQKFMFDSKDIKDHYYVIMYVQDSMEKFVWDNQGLFENVEIGESVTISYRDKDIYSVGYKLKGDANELDMGRDKKKDRVDGGK